MIPGMNDDKSDDPIDSAIQAGAITAMALARLSSQLKQLQADITRYKAENELRFANQAREQAEAQRRISAEYIDALLTTPHDQIRPEIALEGWKLVNTLDDPTRQQAYGQFLGEYWPMGGPEDPKWANIIGQDLERYVNDPANYVPWENQNFRENAPESIPLDHQRPAQPEPEQVPEDQPAEERGTEPAAEIAPEPQPEPAEERAPVETLVDERLKYQEPAAYQYFYDGAEGDAPDMSWLSASEQEAIRERANQDRAQVEREQAEADQQAVAERIKWQEREAYEYFYDGAEGTEPDMSLISETSLDQIQADASQAREADAARPKTLIDERVKEQEPAAYQYFYDGAEGDAPDMSWLPTSEQEAIRERANQARQFETPLTAAEQEKFKDIATRMRTREADLVANGVNAEAAKAHTIKETTHLDLDAPFATNGKKFRNKARNHSANNSKDKSRGR